MHAQPHWPIVWWRLWSDLSRLWKVSLPCGQLRGSCVQRLSQGRLAGCSKRHADRQGDDESTLCACLSTMHSGRRPHPPTDPFSPAADGPVRSQTTIPAILGAVAKVLNAGDETAAQEVLENLVEVAEAHPRFLRKQLSDVVRATLQVRISAWSRLQPRVARKLIPCMRWHQWHGISESMARP